MREGVQRWANPVGARIPLLAAWGARGWAGELPGAGLMSAHYNHPEGLLRGGHFHRDSQAGSVGGEIENPDPGGSEGPGVGSRGEGGGRGTTGDIHRPWIRIRPLARVGEHQVHAADDAREIVGGKCPRPLGGLGPGQHDGRGVFLQQVGPGRSRNRLHSFHPHK